MGRKAGCYCQHIINLKGDICNTLFREGPLTRSQLCQRLKMVTARQIGRLNYCLNRLWIADKKITRQMTKNHLEYLLVNQDQR